MRAAVPSLSGALVLRNLASFERRVGRDAVQQGLASLPDCLREEFAAAVPAAWLPARDVDALYAAIADAAGESIASLYPIVIREGVEKTLRTVWRVLLRITTDRALIQRAPLVYERSHSHGTIVAKILGPGRAQAELVDWPDVSDLRRIGIGKGIEAFLCVAGRRNAYATVTATPGGAAYSLTWDA